LALSERVKWRTFTDESLKRWSVYVCGSCERLVFDRHAKTWVCGRGHSITKNYCSDWVDGIMSIRIRMPDDCFMYLGEQ
jgi:hypothetical protein